MDDSVRRPFGVVEPMRTDFIPASDYTSREFLRLENRKMWPRAWHVACREEELPDVGSYLTFDICDQSVVLVRTAPETIKAYYNVCMHRGRRLTEGHGKINRFHCNYHGWQYDLNGRITRVQDRQDWQGCPGMEDSDISLREVKTGTWAGFVFINMDPSSEPLAQFLDPVPEYLDPFEIEKMRYRWYVTIKVPANWKATLEGFDEGYHVFSTHPQWPPMTDDVTRSFTFGKHGMFAYPTARMFGQPSARIRPELEDVRENLIAFYDDLNTSLAALYSERATEAVRRLRTEVPAGTPQIEILMKMYGFIKEAAIACGAGWPRVTMEEMAKAGVDWHIFPNLIILQQPDAALVYRSRPFGDDPDWCIFDVWSLQRYAPGAQPLLKRRVHMGDDEWRRIDDVSPVLLQDFSNLVKVQQGMKSLGFPGCRTNPLQESAVSNFHLALREYLKD
jgi:phenylpropionate dioxygenase-like ring-hydroxylating dioxygenase large terminal subunit